MRREGEKEKKRNEKGQRRRTGCTEDEECLDTTFPKNFVTVVN
jgi:hypothetical protein